MSLFTPDQEAAIEQKSVLLERLLDGNLSDDEFAVRAAEVERTLTERRTSWFKKNLYEFWPLIRGLSDVQAAFALLYGFYMRVDGKDLTVIPHEDDFGNIYAARIISANFCPYLEAMSRAGVTPERSNRICEKVLEGPCQAAMRELFPGLTFTRDYSRIRPQADACVEDIHQTYYPEAIAFAERFDEEGIVDAVPGQFAFPFEQGLVEYVRTLDT